MVRITSIIRILLYCTIAISQNLTLRLGVLHTDYSGRHKCFRNIENFKHCGQKGKIGFSEYALTKLLPIENLEFKLFKLWINESNKQDNTTLFGAMLAGSKFLEAF